MEGKVRGCHPLMELVWGAGESTKWRCPSTEGWLQCAFKWFEVDWAQSTFRGGLKWIEVDWAPVSIRNHTRLQPRRCLERRQVAWKDGDLAALVKDGRTIQQRFPKTRPQNVENENRLAWCFAKLMFQGKTHAVLDLLANCGKGGVLCLDQPANPNDPDSKTIREALASKHSMSHPASPDSSLLGPPPEIHPVVFDSIDARHIRSTALRMSGAAGPSGLDVHAWRRMCTASRQLPNPYASLWQMYQNALLLPRRIWRPGPTPCL